MASGDANLRATPQSRQLESSNQSSGAGKWYYFMLNMVGQCPPNNCNCCKGPGLPFKPEWCSSEKCNSSTSDGDDDDRLSSTSSTTSSTTATTNDADEDRDTSDSYDNGNNNTQDQYLTEYSNGGSGSANNVGNSNNLTVWAFLAAALVVGIVAAALMAKKVSLLLCVSNSFSNLYVSMSCSQIGLFFCNK